MQIGLQNSYDVLSVYCCDSDDSDTVQQFNSTTTSASTVNCSPRWIVYPNSRALNARSVTAATTQQLCLRACINRDNCVAVDWSRPSREGCWIHDEHRETEQFRGITHFVIVNRCNSTLGK